MTQPEPSYRLIALTKGQFTKVSAHRFEELNRFRWYATWHREGNCFTVARAVTVSPGKQKTILMARFILGAKKGEQVDHVNGEPLDNTDENIRIATPQQNCCNRKQRSDSKQPYKGVSLSRTGQWRAEIQAKGIRYFLGQFKTPEKARDVYIDAAKELQKDFHCAGRDVAIGSVAPDAHVIALRSKGLKKGPKPIQRPPIMQPDDPAIRYISLPGEYFAIVDADDYEKQNHHHWRALVNEGYGTVYAQRSGYENGRKFNIWLHKEILGVGRGVIVDHINGNTLDCRKCNLRIATIDENARNHKMRKDNQSGYKGVCEYKPKGWTPTKKWKAQIRIGGKTTSLGYFMTPQEAHAVYKRACDEYYREFANY